MSFVDSLPELNKTATRYLERSQEKLKYCITCQPYDGGDYIWVMGTETTVYEIFDEVKVPEKYREDIAAHLYCPNCGRDGFDQSDVAGTEDIDDIGIRTEIKRKERVFREFADKVQDLKDYLSNYPSLALAHPTGRKIRQEIQKSKKDAVTIPVQQWARARIQEGEKVFSSSDLTAPDVGLSLGGRFHHKGQSVLYLAENAKLAIIEVLDQSSLIWVQTYVQNSQIDNILDLRKDWKNISLTESETLQALLASNFVFDKVEDRCSNWKPQYLLPNFIADCAREAGFRGIVYTSTRGEGYNLVLFDPKDSSIEPIDSLDVRTHKPSTNTDVETPFDPTSLF